MVAFEGCEKLMILSVPRQTQLGIEFIADTALLRVSPFTVDRLGRYEVNQHDEVVEWLLNINSDSEIGLHRICAFFNPKEDEVLEILRVQGLGILRRRNELGMTPMDYLAMNPYSNVKMQKVVNRYILRMMGEFQLEFNETTEG